MNPAPPVTNACISSSSGILTAVHLVAVGSPRTSSPSTAPPSTTAPSPDPGSGPDDGILHEGAGTDHGPGEHAPSPDTMAPAPTARPARRPRR